MEVKQFIRELQEIATSVNPLKMVTHCENCNQCKILLQSAQVVINLHMQEKKDS